MKAKLSQLTMAQYIDVLCGDVGLLAEIIGENGRRGKPGEATTGNSRHCENGMLEAVRSELVFEYMSIAHPADAQGMLSRKSERMGGGSALAFFTVLHSLCEMGAQSDVRQLLKEYGIDATGYDDARTLAEVEQRMRRAKSMAERERGEEEAQTDDEPEQIRRSFSQQVASLMSHFKFQININEMKADVFASLVAQADREVKAQMSAMKK